MISHELTALWGVDHAASLTMVHTHLLREMIDEKREKLEQMGKNVFSLNPSKDLAERTINAIGLFYQTMQSPITFPVEDKAKAINTVISMLEDNGFTKLGENQSITPKRVKSILNNTFS
ncbi:hypothetical protein L0B53_15715 [Vibrio sp. SS-MA-C1-2]|uniref:hypothetical protein n=1 Tax=Vibrio sp. SS-MA-C1-2 TaxID=2908646 RepID=UPI001F1F7831|nr:hypothetical protein [Vibrio sp. SS-MA-C1-2]UJF18453.1 hypothetical protein L0B53_15715 [Vibrio sp. SS-MA-C1-2]